MCTLHRSSLQSPESSSCVKSNILLFPIVAKGNIQIVDPVKTKMGTFL